MKYKILSKNTINKRWRTFDWFDTKEDCKESYDWLCENLTSWKFKIRRA